MEKWVNPRNRVLALLPFYAGLRLGEVVALDLDDIRLSARKGLIIVRMGKGGKYREIPVHPQLRPGLALWIDDERPHLMRLHAARAGLRMSVRELLRELAGIGETVLLYHGDRAGPEPTACSPRPARSRTNSPHFSTSAATPPDADVGNTRKPPPDPQLTSENSPP